MIYLDNAATSWPKPPEVREAIVRFLDKTGGNPGRSGHGLSIEAGKIVYNTREMIAKLFNAPEPLRVIFSLNATHAINLALFGMLQPGDRVVTTAMEHNCVMRPLRALESMGVEVAVAGCSREGLLDIDEFKNLVGEGCRLVVINAASNVIGTVQDIHKAARIAHEAGALILADTAQTAGVLDIDIQEMDIDLLAFSGHKGLLGPTGTGGLVIGKNIDTAEMEPIFYGGTGSKSEYEEQPEFLPDKFESGTPNSVGIAGLGAGISYVLDMGLNKIREREVELTQALIDGLNSIERVKVYGTGNANSSTAIVSFTIEGMQVSDIGLRLMEDFGIMSRVGLHCAPAAHKTIGTFPEGTVRLAPGIFTMPDEITQTIEAVIKIANNKAEYKIILGPYIRFI